MSSMNLGSLFVTLNADSKGLASGMARASEVVEKFAKETKKLANDVAQVSGGLLALGGAAVGLAATVDSKAAASMARLEKSTKLVAVQVADILRPAVDQLAKTFRKLADWIAGLDPEVKKNLATWAIWAAQIAVAAKAIGTIFGLLDGVAGAFGAMAKAIAAVGIVPLLEVAIVVAGLIALVIVLHRAWRKNWLGIQDVVQDVVTWFQDSFTGLGGFLKSFWDFQIDGVAAFVDVLLSALEVVERVSGKKIGGENGVAGLRAGFKGMFDDLKSGAFFAEAIKFGKKIGTDVGDAALEEIGIIKAEVMKKLGLSGGLSSGGKARQPSMGKNPIRSGALQPDLFKGAVNFGQEFLHEAKRMDAQAKKLADAREKELHERLKIISDLNEVKRLGKASATGDLTGLTDQEKQKVTADTGGAWKDLTEAQKNFGNFAERMGPTLLSSLGKAGQSISNIIQGATTGGPFGALMATILEIVQTMASFQNLLADLAFVFERIGQFLEPLIGTIFDFVGDVLAVVIESLAPIFTALQPLFTALIEPLRALTPIFGLLGYLFAALGPVIEVLARITGALVSVLKPIIQGLFYVVKGVLMVIVGAVTGLGKALMGIWNAIVDAIAWVVEGVVNILTAGLGGKAVGDSIRAGKGNLAVIEDPMKALVDATWDSEMATTAQTAATWDVFRANKETAGSAREVAEALSNVPSGYKVALARFQAETPMGGSMDGGDGSIVVGTIIIQGVTGLDPVVMAEKIRQASKARKALLTGSGFSGGEP